MEHEKSFQLRDSYLSYLKRPESGYIFNSETLEEKKHDWKRPMVLAESRLITPWHFKYFLIEKQKFFVVLVIFAYDRDVL